MMIKTAMKLADFDLIEIYRYVLMDDIVVLRIPLGGVSIL